MKTVQLKTAGNGLWSNVAKTVTITNMRLAYVNDENDFGELRVYFDTATWDVSKDGLIYTDKKFLKGLRDLLVAHGLSDDVEYSEQGMQGDNYVSLDVDEAFIKTWDAKFNVFA